MSRLWMRIAVSLLLGTLSGSLQASATTHTFQVKIHRKVSPGATPPAGGPCQITWVKFTMSFATDPGVTITGINVQITEPDLQNNGSPAETWPPAPGQALTPTMTPVNHTFQIPPAFGGVTPLAGDTVYLSAPDKTNLAGYDTLQYQRYEIDFALTSNYDLTGKSYQQPDPDIYTVVANVTTSGAAETLSGLCVESYDPLNRSIVNASCASTQTYWIPITDPLQTELVVDGTLQATKQCFRDRKGVDAFLVLDKSGSMASSTLGSDAEPKIEALQEAVRDFVNAWDDTRTFFDASPPNDQIGVALFDSSAVPWTDGTLTSGLNVFAGADTKILNNLNPPCTATSCGQLVPGTSTSIGSGLLLADPGFPNDGNRHVVLLMTDGMQNTDPMVRPYDPGAPANCAPPNPNAIATYTSGNCAVATPLPHEASSNYQLHAVTVGTGLAVSAAINQAIAQASGGFYINTEDNANQLKPFFLELLQNVLKFNSYDTTRMISKSVPPATLPFSTSTPVSTTSRDVEFNLMWPQSRGALRLTVTPPGGAKPIVKESPSGFISIVRQLPLPAPFDPTGNWNILVEATRIVGAPAAATGQQSFPFDIYVMADDGAIKSDLSVVPADYKAGDSIRLRAKLTQLGSPILGLGSHPGDKVQVDLIKPGQSIGDILSDSTASASSSGSDPQSPAEAKLFNTLQNSPSSLKHASDSVQLFDDGKPEHGDDVAGDGIYSALYPAVLTGHYNFLFSIESTDPHSVRFSRQQLRTAYVRSVPDAGNTVFQTSVFRRDNGNVLSIVMTPRVKPGPGCLKNDPKCGRMGPGWANYFWFTAPGQTPFKAVDNLNGTYTATLAFNGSTPPPVSVHFENVLATIGDSVTPDHLPDPLGPGNVVTVVLPPKGVGKVAVFLDAGAGIPHGTFGNAFNTGFSLNAGLEYIATSHFSAEGIFGYHHFPAKVGSAVDLYQFSANGKAYLTTGGSLRPFVNAGIGGYKASPGSTYFGGNVGGGVLKELSPHWGVQASYNFHVVNTPGAATKFSTAQLGIRYVF
jgi:hypothetical protein